MKSRLEDQTLLISVCVFVAQHTCERKMKLLFLNAYLWEETNRVNVGVAVCECSVVSLCDCRQALHHVSIVLHLNIFRSNLR